MKSIAMMKSGSNHQNNTMRQRGRLFGCFEAKNNEELIVGGKDDGDSSSPAGSVNELGTAGAGLAKKRNPN
jgi:hypothetical protein